ncbi:MAG: C13 family peptidase [Silanimonas sp.]
MLKLLRGLAPAAVVVRGFVVAIGLLAWSAAATERVPEGQHGDEQAMAENGEGWDEFEPPSFDAEAAIYAQGTRLDASLAALRPQTPGKVDLYVLAMGGDATEDVFRNEVEFVGQQFETRFGAEGRVLTLLNHADTVERQPLATRTNLRRAIAGLGKVMDPAEDVLLFFVTSHGSEDHALSMHMPPIALNDVVPADLSAALDDTGIQWRVLVVSACYSGGFVEPLKGPKALVITAARADRTSFGCGAHSEITYFGEAYFAEAMNQTASFIEAFAIARKAVAERERAEGFEPSRPQIAVGEGIEAKLAAWQAGVTLGPAVPFKPAAAAVPSTPADD